MAANVENVPEPGADRVVPDYDQEKNITTVHQAPDQADLKDSDANSEKFQGGVQRARAITTIWSRKELWAMFILCVGEYPPLIHCRTGLITVPVSISYPLSMRF